MKFSASLGIDADKVEAQGITPYEAFDNLALEIPKLFKGRGVLLLKQGDRFSTANLNIMQAKRFGFNKNYRDVLAKRLFITLS